MSTPRADDRIDRLVDELFGTARYGEYCRNPVTGGGYVHGVEPIAPQKEAARRALLAREWFAIHGPPDLQPLPLGYAERETLKHGGADHILAWYARSLECLNYDVVMHPSFEDHACGVMASEHCPYFIKQDEALQRRFPPRRLEWLNNAMVWEPPAHIRKRRGRKMARAALKGRGSGHVVAGEAAQSESGTGCAGR